MKDCRPNLGLLSRIHFHGKTRLEALPLRDGTFTSVVSQFGFDVKQIGMFAWVPYVGAVISAVFGGWLVPVITTQSYVPFFVMGAILVPPVYVLIPFVLV